MTVSVISMDLIVADFTPLRVREEILGIGQQGVQAPAKQPPPYNGFGGEEDSLNSSQALIPRPPKRDFVKFMGKDRLGLDGNVLRFLAKLDAAKAIDAERKFVISYFLADDTVVVFEPTVRNSGNLLPDSNFLNCSLHSRIMSHRRVFSFEQPE